VPDAKVARFASRHGLVGAEFLAGIPGTVGGALAMNAGCYGAETWQVVDEVLVLGRDGELRRRRTVDYDIGYRHVVLKEARQEWFAAAWLKLQPGDGEGARLQMKALLEKRSASQPLHLPNAGSVFRNPEGDFAGRLIEACGLKGKCLGGAQVSEKHANFIVNAGGATAADIEGLIELVRETVKKDCGVELVSEVKIIGDKA
jgi:UDP-N-acetylmuramate dehydrogenase